jgi:hypothetical protein
VGEGGEGEGRGSVSRYGEDKTLERGGGGWGGGDCVKTDKLELAQHEQDRHLFSKVLM